MKKCPNCNETLGDNATICFMCRYDFESRSIKKRPVKSPEKTIEENEKKKEQETKELEEYRRMMKQIESNPKFEYDVCEVRVGRTYDMSTMDMSTMIRNHAASGWRLHTVTYKDINTHLLIFERRIG